jgi:hypothetical protein
MLVFILENKQMVHQREKGLQPAIFRSMTKEADGLDDGLLKMERLNRLWLDPAPKSQHK